jgi:hypothetical protein
MTERKGLPWTCIRCLMTFFVSWTIEDVPSKGFMKASLEIAAQAPADAVISYIPSRIPVATG